MHLKNVPIGQKFIHNGTHYMRIKDIHILKEKYPDSVVALNLDTYEPVIISDMYDVQEYDTMIYICTAECCYENKCECHTLSEVTDMFNKHKDGCPCGYKSIWTLKKV